ncbi:sigma-70 family RNA polymerase sigma factor [Segatella copri]|uniref:Sigma-70 family RNA polymerase sigma factor n=1 Tax=Segatella copri TaxID=165179 RepID=A0AAW9THM0_9BACT|nr:sigma-70 family RNA polymerase sigma factor [Segatella copri]MQN26752.1 sigma-70 family RNA polymerase sigma factor [Segatella copri]MQN32116.1 sigma-70 family RNA polymerase sigma factor [Segatella copri]MQN39076.1 sigma-70 family RNA polymerase sigma factor [Segatella copri]MQN76249.1 sigma-70 family RNA polymerase sigma factor [Segatella copri]MQO26285.1 sigma-70 family RNA polymerase sigma factor [Segatella copri]
MASNITTLVEKAKQGDADAFSTLYQMYYPKMKGICINILREDKAVVDDLVQDAFILALVSLKDLKNTHRFSQWLTSITTNLVLKYQEKGKRYDFISLSEIEDEFSSVLEDDNTSRQSISYEEIMSAIDSLPEGYKKIFNMSVLDGLSHQEISELLDIAPHSSSSQLSRAKAMLRNILSPRAMLIIVLALIVIPVYRYFTAKKKLVSENDVNIVRTRKSNEDITPIQKKPNVSVSRTQNAVLCSNHRSVQQGKNIVITVGDSIKTGQNVILEISDSLQENQYVLADNKRDSIIKKDSVYTPIPNEERWIADDTRTHKKSKWQLLAAGSLGTTLAQNVYKIITSSNNNIGSSQPSGPDQPTTPDQPSEKSFTTWEEYAEYLHRLTPTDPTAENVAMMDIADNNKGKIEEYEHHDKPITLGLAVNKNIGKHWSLETGLQYSYLKSYFTLGTGNYRVDKEQKLHYIGIPIKLSYQFMAYKRLSAYGSAGASIQIPLSGKTYADYVIGGKSGYTTDWKTIPSIQWTVNTNIGIQYQFAPKLTLFVEPTLNWYIPNGSEVKNTWTERPFTLTVPFGIRLSW